MKINDRVIQTIEQNAQIRDSGGYIAIPWINLPKLSACIPGIQKGRYYLVTANSKVGKTQLADFLFLFEPLAWIKANPTANLKPRIFYFSLEMSKEDKILSAFAHYIFKKTSKIYTPEKLLSVFHNEHLSAEDIEIVKSVKPDLDFLEERVTFIDNIRNPFGIYKYMREYAERNGHYVYKEMRFTKPDNTVELKQVIDYYVPNNPEEIPIIMIDHMSLFTPEKGGTLHDAMSKFSTEYALSLRDLYRYVVVGIQQQAAASEAQQFTQSGSQIVAKLKPTTDGLGDNKLTQRDVDMMFGLFSPQRYNIPEYHGYNINRLGDHYREFLVILNRRGGGNKHDDLFFHGAINLFKELPDPSDSKIQAVYELADKLQR